MNSNNERRPTTRTMKTNNDRRLPTTTDDDRRWQTTNNEKTKKGKERKTYIWLLAICQILHRLSVGLARYHVRICLPVLAICQPLTKLGHGSVTVKLTFLAKIAIYGMRIHTSFCVWPYNFRAILPNHARLFSSVSDLAFSNFIHLGFCFSFSLDSPNPIGARNSRVHLRMLPSVLWRLHLRQVLLIFDFNYQAIL